MPSDDKIKNTKTDSDDDKPKRPLSAYNIFFRDERARLLEVTPVRQEGKPRRSHGKIGFAEMARKIGAKWKALEKKDRKLYDDQAKADKARYVSEMKVYKEKLEADAVLRQSQQEQQSQLKMELQQHHHNQGLFSSSSAASTKHVVQ